MTDTEREKQAKEFADEKRDRRAKAMAAMGLVERKADGLYYVSTPSLRGRQTQYKIWRDEKLKKVMCNCLEFEELFKNDKTFRCEHIIAVKYAVVQKTVKQAEKPKDEPYNTSAVEFIEAILQIKLTERQKEVIKLLENNKRLVISWKRSDIRRM